MAKEVWKDIPGFKDYQASNYGRVKSITRRIKRIDNRTNKYVHQICYGKILNPTPKENDYLYIELNKNGIRYYQQVGYFILLTFVSQKPMGKNITVSHLDNNPLNNKPENLVWESQLENNIRQSRIKLDKNKVIRIKQLLKLGIKQAHVAKMFNVHKTHINNIKSGVCWGNIKL